MATEPKSRKFQQRLWERKIAYYRCKRFSYFVIELETRKKDLACDQHFLYSLYKGIITVEHERKISKSNDKNTENSFLFFLDSNPRFTMPTISPIQTTTDQKALYSNNANGIKNRLLSWPYVWPWNIQTGTAAPELVLFTAGDSWPIS